MKGRGVKSQLRTAVNPMNVQQKLHPAHLREHRKKKNNRLGLVPVRRNLRVALPPL